MSISLGPDNDWLLGCVLPQSKTLESVAVLGSPVSVCSQARPWLGLSYPNKLLRAQMESCPLRLCELNETKGQGRLRTQ